MRTATTFDEQDRKDRLLALDDLDHPDVTHWYWAGEDSSTALCGKDLRTVPFAPEDDDPVCIHCYLAAIK